MLELGSSLQGEAEFSRVAKALTQVDHGIRTLVCVVKAEFKHIPPSNGGPKMEDYVLYSRETSTSREIATFLQAEVFGSGKSLWSQCSRTVGDRVDGLACVTERGAELSHFSAHDIQLYYTQRWY